MKNKLSILFLIVYLFTATSFLELLKIPILIEHYVEHKNTDKNLSFIGFMVIHYFSKTVIDQDYEKDKKLPFKSDNTCNNCNVSHVYISQYNKVDIQDFFNETTLNTYYFIKDDFSISRCHNNIWQPPKYC